MHCICTFLYFVTKYSGRFSYQISKNSICTKIFTDHFDFKDYIFVKSHPWKTTNSLFDAVFRALSTGVFKIVKRERLHAKIFAEKLFHFLVDIR